MKVFFLCKRYYTNKDLLSERFGRLFHLPVGLARLGIEVEVHALDYRHSQPLTATHEGVAFNAVPASITRLPSAHRHIQRVARQVRPDCIVASGDSHIGFWGSRLATDVGAAFAFDVYDYYPVFGTNRIPGMRRLFALAVHRSDITFCASTPLMQRLSNQSKRVILVENGVDREVFRSYQKHEARQALGLPPDTPLIGYFGSITPDRGPLLFDAVEMIKASLPGVSLLLAGSVQGVTLPTESVIYKGVLPQDKLPLLISACDIATVPYARSEFNDMAGPCKIAEYLACGVPVVATRVAGHELFFKDAPESLCEPDADDLGAALLRQMAEPKVAPFPARLDWAYISSRVSDELALLGA